MAPTLQVSVASTGADAVNKLVIHVNQPLTTYLGIKTNYEYNLTHSVGDAHVIVTASSIYGVVYGLESFVQLLDGNSLIHESIEVSFSGIHEASLMCSC